jgi:beta-lysine 5,6-aminomutase alpha subunit
MPPTKHITGNIFQAHLMDMMFNVCSLMTGQSIHLVGILTEAIHTPFVGDRYLSLSGANYARKNMKHISSEIAFSPGGKVQKRAQKVLKEAYEMLHLISDIGLLEALRRGMFADIKRDPDGGKGKEGIIRKDAAYYNPFMS